MFVARRGRLHSSRKQVPRVRLPRLSPAPARATHGRASAISALLLALTVSTIAGCAAETNAAPSSDRPVTLRLGYIPNATHAQSLVGLERGTFAEALGPGVRLEAKQFNGGPSVIEALFAGAIDASYIGPNPAVNGYVHSEGKALRIIAGATSGGALFIVRPGSNIHSPADLAGKKIASPQFGNTQDVALRAYLRANGLKSRDDGGNVAVFNTSNANTLTLFQKGDIDGAWAPEPWATRLIQEAGGTLFLDERTLWPDGDFVTTQLIVSAEFLNRHPDAVEDLVRAHVDITDWTNANRDAAAQLVSRRIEADTGAPMPVSLVTASWANMRITADPLPSTLRKSAHDAYALGFLASEPDLRDIYALGTLNKVLAEKGRPPVRE